MTRLERADFGGAGQRQTDGVEPLEERDGQWRVLDTAKLRRLAAASLADLPEAREPQDHRPA